MWVFVNTKLQSLTWLCTFRITPPEAHSKSGRGTDKLNCCMSPFNSWLGKSRSLNEAPAAVLSWARCGDRGGAGLRVAFLFCFVTCRKLMDLPVWWQYGQPSVSPSISREYFLSPPWSLWMPLPFPCVSSEVQWNVCCMNFTLSLAGVPCALGHPGSLGSTLLLLKAFGESAEIFVCEFLHCKELLMPLNLLSLIFSHWLFKNSSLLYNIFQLLSQQCWK